MATTTLARGAGAGASAASLRRSHPRYGERVIVAVLFTFAFVSVLTTVGIVVTLLQVTVEFFGDVSLAEFFTSTSWAPLFAQRSFGVWPLVTATATVSVIAMLVAVPLGLGAAAYLSEYASRRTRKIFKPVLEVLAGIPTVVYGFFALTVIAAPVLQRL